MTDILTALNKYFHHKKFKSTLQENAIKEICKRQKDVFISMPTGSGKSLCYQLPAVLCENKVAIVVSPLLALIKNQIDILTSLQIKATTINSKTNANERKSIIGDLLGIVKNKTTSKDKLKQTKLFEVVETKSSNTKLTIKLLYITPEQAATNTFKSIFTKLVELDRVSYFVIDEAHCVSEWGHDFRPDYINLGLYRNFGSNIPWIVLTATASKDVTRDIITALKLRDGYAKFKTPSFRDNLFYDVMFQDILPNPIEHLKEFISTCFREDVDKIKESDKKGCGIIYCRTRLATEQLCEDLKMKGISVISYHAGLSDKERHQAQDKWQNGDIRVICATNSFGMGVDKATVRFVVHWGVASNIASYYQESGRAGRDGKKSKCRIYYAQVDRNALQYNLGQTFSEAENDKKRKIAENALQNFLKMVDYCESANSCRHLVFSSFFDDTDIPPCKTLCDICLNKTAVVKLIEAYVSASVQTRTSIYHPSKYDNECLYEGGRHGQRNEYEYYASTANDSDDDGDGCREQQAKKETEEFIKKQFEIRKASSIYNEKKFEENDANVLKYARVRAAESTSTKVANLTILLREKYLETINQALKNNYDQYQMESEQKLMRFNIEDCAKDMEYIHFTNSTVLTMYRAAIAKQVSKIKTTKHLVEELATFDKNKHKKGTLKEFFSESDTNNGTLEFKTAKQAFKESKMLESDSKMKVDSKQSRLTSFLESDQPVKTTKRKLKISQLFGVDDTLNGNDKNKKQKLIEDDESGESNIKQGDGNVSKKQLVKQINKNSKMKVEEIDLTRNLTKKSSEITSEDSQIFDICPKKESDNRSEENIKQHDDVLDEINTKKMKKVELSETSIEKISSKIDIEKEIKNSDDNSTEKKTEKLENSCEKNENVTEKLNVNNDQVTGPETTESTDINKCKENTHKRHEHDKEKLKRHCSNKDVKHREHKEKKPSKSIVKEGDKEKKQSTHKSEKKEHSETKIEKKTGGDSVKEFIAILVVNLLTPAYKEKRIASKDLFKITARKLSHLLLNKGCSDRSSIKKCISEFLKHHQEIKSEDDINFLCIFRIATLSAGFTFSFKVDFNTKADFKTYFTFGTVLQSNLKDR